jgi:hypothetical protein
MFIFTLNIINSAVQLGSTQCSAFCACRELAALLYLLLVPPQLLAG